MKNKPKKLEVAQTEGNPVERKRLTIEDLKLVYKLLENGMPKRSKPVAYYASQETVSVITKNCLSVDFYMSRMFYVAHGSINLIIDDSIPFGYMKRNTSRQFLAYSDNIEEVIKSRASMLTPLFIDKRK